MNEKKSYGWVVALLAAVEPVRQALGAIVDGQVRVRDPQNGAWVWSSHSNYSSVAALAIFAAIAVLSAAILVRDSMGEARALRLKIVAAAWPFTMLLASVFRTEGLVVFYVAIGLAVLLAANAGVWTRRDTGRVAVVLLLSLAAAWAFALVNPTRGLGICREDKCSPIGRILIGFFSTENVIALMALFCMPLVLVAFRPVWKWSAVLFLVGTISATGSRTSLVSAALLIGLYWMASWLDAPVRRILRVVSTAILALGFLVTSTWFVWFVQNPSFLTGRGFIWSLVRKGVADSPLLGSGREVFTIAFESRSSSGFLIAHEHNLLGYVLLCGGILGLIVFLVWLGAVVKSLNVVVDEGALTQAPSPGSGAAWELSHEDAVNTVWLLTVVALIAGVAEPSVQWDSRSPSIWALVILTLLVSKLQMDDARPTDGAASERAAVRMARRAAASNREKPQRGKRKPPRRAARPSTLSGYSYGPSAGYGPQSAAGSSRVSPSAPNRQRMPSDPHAHRG